MKKSLVIAAAILMPMGVSAQTNRDQAFDEIGRSLGEVQRAISAQAPSGGARSSGGATVLKQEVPAYQQPNASTAPAILSTGTSISNVGPQQGGFTQVTPSSGPYQGQTVYVPSSEIQKAGVSDYVSGQAIEQAMAAIKAMATKIENNPYVRLKGFKVNLSVSPSVDFDFEMKGAEAESLK